MRRVNTDTRLGTEPAPSSKRRNASYQKKNLDKKLASSTGDFCILSAPPVWFVCTWVAPERVGHICVPCVAPCARPRREDVLASSVLHFASLQPLQLGFLASPRTRPLPSLCSSVRQWEDWPSFMGSQKRTETHVTSTPPGLRIVATQTKWTTTTGSSPSEVINVVRTVYIAVSGFSCFVKMSALKPKR